MGQDEKLAKRRLNADEKRALEAETMRSFVQQYGRKAQKRIEPNDRHYDRAVERRAKRMPPEALDALLNDEDA